MVMKKCLYPVILIIFIVFQSCLSTDKLINCPNFKHKTKNNSKWIKLDKRNSSKKTKGLVFEKKKHPERIINKIVAKRINKITSSNSDVQLQKAQIELNNIKNKMLNDELQKLNIKNSELVSNATNWVLENEKNSNRTIKYNKIRKSYEQIIKGNKFILKKDSTQKMNPEEKKIIGFATGSIGSFLLIGVVGLILFNASVNLVNSLFVIFAILSLILAIISLDKLKKYNLQRMNKGLPKFRFTKLALILNIIAIIYSALILIGGILALTLDFDF